VPIQTWTKKRRIFCQSPPPPWEATKPVWNWIWFDSFAHSFQKMAMKKKMAMILKKMRKIELI
jgi:hypothetical protein